MFPNLAFPDQYLLYWDWLKKTVQKTSLDIFIGACFHNLNSQNGDKSRPAKAATVPHLVFSCLHWSAPSYLVDKSHQGNSGQFQMSLSIMVVHCTLPSVYGCWLSFVTAVSHCCMCLNSLQQHITSTLVVILLSPEDISLPALITLLYLQGGCCL